MAEPYVNPERAFDPQSGDMRALVETSDWHKTELGDAATWPPCLRGALRACLAQAAPSAVFWGPELRVLYNDPYARLLGDRHPRAFGAPAADPCAFPELASGEAPGARLSAAAARGEAALVRNLDFVTRRGGRAGRALFEIAASPVFDEEGRVGGLYCVLREARPAPPEAAERGRGEPSAAAVLRDAPFGFGLWDAGSRFCAVNDALAALAGAPPGAHVGRALDELRPGARAEARAIRRVLETGTPETLEVEAELPAFPGVARHYVAAFFPVRAQGGEAFVAALYVDATEAKRAEQERGELFQRAEAARAEAERQGRLKDEFLATVSHELRTPLQAILGWARLLSGTRLPEGPKGPAAERLARGLSVIARSAEVQAHLIEDILDVSRIVAGKVRIAEVPIDLSDVVRAAIDTVSPAASAKSIALRWEVQPSVAFVRGDADRLQQVVWNLITNAVKFTPREGGVDVCLERRGDRAVVVVSDTGRGIDPAFLPHVFERFRQADGGTTRTEGGLGLGLAIVKHLVELHGGTVRAESGGEGCGATFTVALPLIERPEQVQPLRPVAAQPAPRRRPAEAEHRLSGKRVLVVDDEPEARELLVLALERSGAELAAAGSVEEAMVALERLRPHVIVSDLAMPGADGYALIRRVRALSDEDPLGSIPALALTAHARAEDRRAALEAGFQRHVAKPIDPRALVEALLELTSPEP